MKLTVQLLTWNGAKYILHLFNSLKNQTFMDWELHVLDNASTDNTVELIKRELSNISVHCELEVNKENVGFAQGHNQLSNQSNTEYFLLLNQDLFLEKGCFEKLVSFLDANGDAASVSPRLMKWDFSNNFFTDKIDSLGLKVYKNRRVVDWMQGEEWKEANDQVTEVFGVSGTMPMFRHNVIDNLTFANHNIFDENYGSYKEDVDLAFRIRSYGYRSFVLLDAVAYHDRSSNFDSSIIKNKKGQSKGVKYNSYKNHLMTIYKNEYWQNFVLDFPWILWYEIKKFIWLLLFNPSALKGLKDIWFLRKDLKDKRKQIKNKRKIDWLKMRKWL